MSYHVIIPENSKDPFAVPAGYTSWEPAFYPHDERDYFNVQEAAWILTTKRIIRRAKDGGIQQTRKWIREGKIGHAYLFKKSRKYGYLIPKEVFALFYEEMTITPFNENEWQHCLIHAENEDYFEHQEERFEREEIAVLRKLKNKKLKQEHVDRLDRRLETVRYLRKYYRVKWYEIILNNPSS